VKIHQHIINWVSSIATGAYHYLSKKLSDLAARISEVAHKVFNKTTTQSPAKTFSATPIHTTPLTLEELKKELDKWKNTPGKESEPREKASQIIIDCFNNQSDTLTLVFESVSISEAPLKLTDLPPVIGRLTHLERLDVAQNNLSSLPNTVDGLINLKRLNISSNTFTHLPNQVTNLIKLTHLDLSGNLCEQLPSLNNLTQLHYLNIGENQLSTLPDISKLRNLQWLIASYNQIENVPVHIGELKNLVHLYLNDNKIRTIPKEISNLTTLFEANLNNNQLEHLPPTMGKMAYLRNLDIDGNPLVELPISLGNIPNLRLNGTDPLFQNKTPPREIEDHGRTIYIQEGPANYLVHRCAILSENDSEQLSSLLHLWTLAAKRTDTLPTTDLTSEEEDELEYWLTDTAAFNCVEGKQEETADKVCHMIKHLNNPEWKASFMENIEAGESVDALYEKYLKQSIIRTDKSD
jgi:hypothetical protein